MKELSRTISIRVPRTIIAMNASSQVGALGKELGTESALIVTDQGVVKAGLTGAVEQSLKQENIPFGIFDKCPVSAPISSVLDCARVIINNKHNTVIGIGGGSVIDLGKLAVLVASHGGDKSILFDTKLIKKRGVRTIFLPTTAGTGSEVSATAVCTDEDSHRKMAVYHDLNRADVAVLDPVLTMNLPPAITAETGMDALSHGIEAYTSVKANTVADMFAEKTIRLVSENLRLAYAKGSQNPEARYNMMLAASFGILSPLTSSSGYIVHSFSYPLGMMANLGHGKACALMLPYVMEFNLIGNPERFARIAELMGEPVQGLQLREKAERSVVAVKKLIADLRLPKTLGEVGMTKKDIPAMVDYVMKYNMYQVNDNPRMLDRADLEYILETAL